MAEAPDTGVRPTDGGRTVLVTVGLFPGWVALAGLIVASRTGRSGVRTSPRSRP